MFAANWLKLAVVVCTAFILSACGAPDFGTNETAIDVNSKDAGKKLYETNCIGCHGVEGAGIQATGIIDMSKTSFKGKDLSTYVFVDMVQNQKLACDQNCSNLIVGYMQTWSSDNKPDPSTPEPSTPDNGSPSAGGLTGNATRGANLYTDKGCANCHGSNGNGTYKLDASKTSYTHTSAQNNAYPLADFIHVYMANATPGKTCEGQCAADVAAHIRTWDGAGVDDPDLDPVPDTPAPGGGNEPDTGTPGSGGGSPSTGSGDPANGKALYESSDLGCKNCHGLDGKAAISNTPDLDPNKITYLRTGQSGSFSLVEYIDQFMPTPASKCVGNCAEDIAAYIRTWQPEDVVASCEADDINYGRRQMRLLTQSEYEATLYDLLGYTVVAKASGVPADTLVEGFSNQTQTAVTQSYMDAYSAISEQAANYAEQNNFANVANCSSLTNAQCATEFIENFLPKAYRRALTDEEKNRYQKFFSASYSEGDNNEGLKAALRAALASPYFLYRSEMGELVKDIRDRINNGSGSLQAGENSFTAQGSDFAAAGESYVDGNLVFYLYQGWGTTFEYEFTGNDIITVQASGANEANFYPHLFVSIDNVNFGPVYIDSDFEKSFSFEITGVTGKKYVRLYNDKADGAQHIDGQARPITISSITFGDAVVVTEELPPAELDDDGYLLTPYEVASFISYTYTGSMPDADLFAAAANNELNTEAQISTQIERLLATDKAKDHFGEFAAQWLATDKVISITKSNERFPEFDTSMRALMAQEVREIFKHVMFDGNQPVSNIYSNFTFVNNDLANFYGISGVSGNDFQKVDNLTKRGGVLTSGAFMAGFAHEEETSPIKRAVAVRERMLCHKVPPMPTDVQLARDDADTALVDYIAQQGGKITNREEYAFLTKGDVCADCHEAIINPHGFGMEDFDAVGLIRTAGINGKTIDNTGQLVGIAELGDGQVHNFEGARELSDHFVGLSTAESCFAEKGFRFAMGTGHNLYSHTTENAPTLAPDEKSAYQCGIDRMNSAMANDNQNARAAFVALGASDFVRYRKQR